MSENGIKIIQADSEISFDILQTFERQFFPYHVGNVEKKNLASYIVALDPKNLFFSIKIPESSNFDGTGTFGQFKPDLWKHDVVELFIAADEGEQYQEFNLSPSGAYWTVKFSAYRERIPESDAAVPELQFECRTTLSGKILSMKIPRDKLLESCSLGSSSRLNCCAIFGKDPRNYFSTAALNPEKPDFHQISEWGQAQFLPISL